MSIRAMTWALEQAPVSDPTQALVLVALADSAQDDGRNAWPSQATLAKRARVTDRSIRRILRDLETAGIIRRGDQRLVEHLPADRRPVVWDLVLTATGPDTHDRTSTSGRTPTTGRSRPDQEERPDTGVPSRPDTGVRQTVLGNHPSRASTAERGARLPEDYQPSDELRSWARDLRGFTDDQIDEMTDRFRDYWLSITGAKAVRSDWGRAWRNWVAKEDPRRVRAVVRPIRPDGGTPQLTVEQVDDILGPDGWQLPPPPFDPDTTPHDQIQAWIRDQADQHRRQRHDAALARLNGARS